jgi:hypothetical protein
LIATPSTRLLMAVNGGLLIADASGLPTTEGTRGSGAATTRDTLEPGFNFLPSATPCSRTGALPLWDGAQVRIIEHQAHAPGHAALLIEERGFSSPATCFLMS